MGRGKRERKEGQGRKMELHTMIWSSQYRLINTHKFVGFLAGRPTRWILDKTMIGGLPQQLKPHACLTPGLLVTEDLVRYCHTLSYSGIVDLIV